MRLIVRVFDGSGASVHAGAFTDSKAARQRADAIAARARRRGLNVSVTVRPLHGGQTSIEKLLHAMAERPLYTARSFAGRKDGE